MVAQLHEDDRAAPRLDGSESADGDFLVHRGKFVTHAWKEARYPIDRASTQEKAA